MPGAWPAQGYHSKYWFQGPLVPKVRNKMENGAVSSRSRGSRSRQKFTVGWYGLPQASYTALKEFFAETGGGGFPLFSPEDGNTYTVIFSDDELPKGTLVGWRNGEECWDTGVINLEEL